MTRTGARASILFLLSGASLILQSQQNTNRSQKAHHVVVELAAEGVEHWDAVLNNVENLQKAFASEPVEIEVVAHGKGLSMLRRTNLAQAERLAAVAKTGVKFAACENTMRRMKVQRSDLFDFAVTVDSGVAEVVRKQEAGWAYIKGAS